MITLYIDTSDKDVSIAIIKNQKVLSEITKCIPNQHSIYAVAFVKEVLTESALEPQDIDEIVAVNGPGSFTGIRIGLTIAKVYSYIANKKLKLISSLKARALAEEGKYILSLIDAKHNNYYLGLYDHEYNEIIKEQFNTEEEVLKIIAKYNPLIVSNENLTIGNFHVSKVNYNFLKIIEYSKNLPLQNPHNANPKYLKLPQVLEDKK